MMNRSHVEVVVDQILFSAGNFGLLVAASAQGTAGYADIGVIMALYVLLNSGLRGLVSEPLVIGRGPSGRIPLRLIAVAGALASLMIYPALEATTQISPSEIAVVTLAMTVALITDVLRHQHIGSSRVRRAIVLDAVWLAITWVPALQVLFGGRSPTVSAIFFAWGVGGLLGSALGGLRRPPREAGAVEAYRLSELPYSFDLARTGLLTGLGGQSAIWILAAVASPLAVAELRGAMVPLALLGVLVAGASTVVLGADLARTLEWNRLMFVAAIIGAASSAWIWVASRPAIADILVGSLRSEFLAQQVVPIASIGAFGSASVLALAVAKNLEVRHLSRKRLGTIFVYIICVFVGAILEDSRGALLGMSLGSFVSTAYLLWVVRFHVE